MRTLVTSEEIGVGSAKGALTVLGPFVDARTSEVYWRRILTRKYHPV